MAVDIGTLRHVVSSRLGRPVGDPGPWRAEALAGLGFGASIHRISGVASEAGEDLPWSVIRKHVADTGDTEADLRYWRREPLAYASGLLDDLAGVRAPRCYASVETDDGIELWLEDLASDPGPWTTQRAEVVARDLGRMNGAYTAGRPVPTYPWLSRQWLIPWVEQASAGFDELDTARDDPWIARLYSETVAERARAMWDVRHDIYRAFDTMPVVLAHLDTTQQNAFVHAGRTTLIDWAFVGLAAPGEDLAPVVGAAAIFGTALPDELPDLDRAAFAAYVAGLEEAGWRGDGRAVRFVYCASAALRYCVGPIAFFVCGIGSDGRIAHNGGLRDPAQREAFEGMLGRPIDEIVAVGAAIHEFVMGLGAEALGLLDARRG